MRRSLFASLIASAAIAAALAAAMTMAPRSGYAQAYHQSLLRVGDGQVRQIKLGLNKSMIVELPRPVREVMVSNPEQIDAVMQSATRAYLIGKNLGEANILFIDNNGGQVAVLEVTIERDLGALENLIARLVPGSRVHVETVGQNVVLTGSVPTPIDATRASEIVNSFLDSGAAASSTTAGGGGAAVTINNSSGGGGSGGDQGSSRVINMITVEGREQVLLKVSVVEMERNVVKQLGVDLAAIVNSGNFGFAALSALPYPINGAVGAAAGGLLGAGGLPNLVDSRPGAALAGVGWQSGTSQVDAVLRALDQNGLIRTLAEPNLTAISGETANFLAGGEFPIPVAQQLDQITVEFKKFGIGLSFTPVVMSEGLISLKISTEVSELSTEGAVVLRNISIPALKVRRAETAVELPSGGSIVIAGLLSDQSRQAISGYPGLKSLPVLGTLFRSRDFQSKETELVVLVTPYVVKPAARQQLATPSDGFAWASDVNSDLLGQMNRIYGRDPERAPAGDYAGDVGFIVE
ncbi:type II and III secretion system protein family protein [Methyloceanibacter caenitepidi]|uniref:Type II/IV secretion system secretin RcpA/CpaC, associated with Flp pilus assembly n=1 Tax=Methyloceanibacter caenitepidi TaxID=1384459 RepID=A0A0A8K2H7_9HYPH|nr:type II and III secretion system protein family protein [Methyloceanibacter caenitepidi]BAQ16199.1 type II/IV secretion system secretin RcpA/CpaC, associated with Flp pilus assembly [Methyloceanibacter caenitepidi]